MILTVVLAGALARLAPGWDADDLALDSRVTEETLARRSAVRGTNLSFLQFCTTYVGRLLRGDLGWSVLFDRPCAELLRDRVQVTFRMAAIGFLYGCVLALALAGWAAASAGTGTQMALNAAVAALLSVPAPILGLGAALARVPGEAALFLVVFPRMLRYSSTLLTEHKRAPFVLTAHCMGVSRWRLLLVHLLPVALPALAAFAGALVPVTLSAAVPIEVAADIPGLGQLAWKATLGRDIPLLLAVTIVIAVVSVVSNSAAEWAEERRG